MPDSQILSLFDVKPDSEVHSPPKKGIVPKVKKNSSSTPNVSTSSIFQQLNIFTDTDNPQESFDLQVYRTISLIDKEGSLQLNNGQLGYIKKSYQSNSLFSPLLLSKKETIALKQYLEIRKETKELYNSEIQLGQANHSSRQKLNRLYDAFVKQYGHLNSKENIGLIKMDCYAHEVLALEKVVDGNLVKADILLKPVSFQVNDIEEVDTPKEALIASLNKYGRVNIDYMLSLMSKEQVTKELIIEELTGRIFYNPINQQFEIPEVFICGDVLEKIDYIEKYINHFPEDTYAKISLQALQESVPQPIPFDKLDFNFGERWISPKLYSEYMTELFKTEVDIVYKEIIDQYLVDIKESNMIIDREFAIAREGSIIMSGKAILLCALHDTTPNITKKIYKNHEEITVPDHELIQQANIKIGEIRKGFISWLDNRSEEEKLKLAYHYNRLFNCFVKPKYDGSHLTFPDLDLKKLNIPSLYPSQKDAIWMLILNGGGIIDHEVGGGKTLIMCIAAHEQKRMGLKNKPIITGLKANVQSIADTYQAIYPQDTLLYPTEKDFMPAKRKNLFSSIRYNDWSCIILSHEQFGKIPHSLEQQQEIFVSELNDVEENLKVLELQGKNISGRMRRGLVIRQKNLIAKLSQLSHDMEARQDDVADFSNMGIDIVYVDESQQFKNLMFNTRHDRVAGIGNPKGSQRALHMLMAIRSIQEKTGNDLGAVFLSGTVLTNSLTELYLLFKYLRPKAMEKQCITSFDSWAAVYAQKSTEYEIDIINEPILKERFRFFIKVPELSAFYSHITDFRSADDIGLERPKANEILYVVPQTPQQKEYTQRLIQFVKNNSPESGLILDRAPLSDAEMKARKLIATSYSAKMSLDMRLIDSEKYDDHSDNKASHCAKNIAENYYKYNEHKGTQFVFSDLGVYKKEDDNKPNWNIYSEIKQKLVSEYHIPENEIRFIQEAKTKNEKNKLISQTNKGEIRVLMGSTTTLGIGVNAQDKAIASHNLDIPWRPDMLNQRNGRTVRPKNNVAKLYADNQVKIYTYATEKTLDAYKFNLLKNKETFIRQMKTGSLTVRRIDEGQFEQDGISFAEYAAILSGNTDLQDKAKLEKKIMVLDVEQRTFLREQSRNKQSLTEHKKMMEKTETQLNHLRSDWQTFTERCQKDEKGELISPIILNGLKKGDIKSVAGKLHKIKAEYNDENYTVIGSLYGFQLLVKTDYDNEIGRFNRFFIEGESGLKYTHGRGTIANDDKVAVMYFLNALQKIPSLIEKYDKSKEDLFKDINLLTDIVAKEWGKEKEQELVELKDQLSVINMKIDKTIKAENESDENEENQEQKKETNDVTETIPEIKHRPRFR